MEDFSTQLNVLLVDTFNSILRMEESMLKSAGGSGIISVCKGLACL